MQDDSSLPLDVNAMSALPEYPFWGKVSGSLILNLYSGLQFDLSGHSGAECSHSIDHKATGMW